MEIQSFKQWIDTLQEAVGRAKSIGMSEEDINKAAIQLGDYLAENVQPDIRENKLLKELWEVGSEQEKKALASMVVKLVENYNRVH